MMIARVEWGLLETFRVVGRLEHMSRAAHQLETSQPAVSRAVARLEQMVGEPLFQRVGRSVALTHKGRLFLHAIERSHGEMAEVYARLFGRAELVPQAVMLGFLRTLGARTVPQAVQQFRKDHKDVSFSFSQNNTAVIDDELAAGAIDLALTAIPSRSPSIRSEYLFDQELVLIAEKNNKLARKKRVCLSDVAQESFVTFKRGHALRSLIEQLCIASGFKPIISFEGDDSTSIPGFVAAGFGVAIVPGDLSLPQNVIALPTAGPLARRQIGIAWLEGRYMHTNAQRFRDFLIKSGQIRR